MYSLIGDYAIWHTVGNEHSEVQTYTMGDSRRIIPIEVVFRGSWEDCVDYAKAHSIGGRNNQNLT